MYLEYMENSNLFIYSVFEINRSPKLHIVDRTQFLEEFLTPVQYYVDVDVSDKNVKL